MTLALAYAQVYVHENMSRLINSTILIDGIYAILSAPGVHVSRAINSTILIDET